MENCDFSLIRETLFKEACRTLDIPESIGKEYQEENEQLFLNKFRFSFFNWISRNIENINALIIGGLYIQSLSRDENPNDRHRFSGFYFTPLFYMLLNKNPKEKEIRDKINLIECNNSKTWTLRNMVPYIININIIKQKVDDMFKQDKKIDNYFPNGYIVQMNMCGDCQLFSSNKIVTCKGMILSLISKENNIISWKWNINENGTSIDLGILTKINILAKYNSEILTLTEDEFLDLCSILAIIFNLDYIDAFGILGETRINLKSLYGMRNIRYL